MLKYSPAAAAALLFITVCGPKAPVNSDKGLLMIVGGKDKPVAALTEFISHCKDGEILVISSASGVPLESGPEAAEMFRSHGALNADWIFIEDADMASADSIVTRIEQAAGIFFTGGVQSRLMERIGGTPAADAVRELYFERKGAVGGTSAGAAVMSEIMITGDGDFTLLGGGTVVTAPGLGLLDNCIIDQHFVKRSRHNRLLSLVLETQLPGIGIDESTAILYYPDNTFLVTGESAVLVYDPRFCSELPASATGDTSVVGLRLSIIYAGTRFDLDRGRICSN